MAYITYAALVPELRRRLAAEDFELTIYPGAERLCRCCSGAHRDRGPFVRGWNPGGVGVHITAGALGLRSMLTYVRDILVSDPSLPLKSQFATHPNGDVMLISTGRCNHLGSIGSGAAARIRAGSFSTSDPWDDGGRGSGVDGNAMAWGIENITAHTMTAAQRRASVIICAVLAYLGGLDWHGGEDHGHGEVSNQRGKADPNLDMARFRLEVRALVNAWRKPASASHAPSTIPAAPAPVPAATTKELLDMSNEVNYSQPRDQEVAASTIKTLDVGGKAPVGPLKTLIATGYVEVTGLAVGDAVEVQLVAVNLKNSSVWTEVIDSLGGQRKGWPKRSVTFVGDAGTNYELRLRLRNENEYPVTVRKAGLDLAWEK